MSLLNSSPSSSPTKGGDQVVYIVCVCIPAFVLISVLVFYLVKHHTTTIRVANPAPASTTITTTITTTLTTIDPVPDYMSESLPYYERPPVYVEKEAVEKVVNCEDYCADDVNGNVCEVV